MIKVCSLALKMLNGHQILMSTKDHKSDNTKQNLSIYKHKPLLPNNIYAKFQGNLYKVLLCGGVFK